jgi:putative hemolysin
MDVFLIVCLTLLNGLFAMSEMALSASRRPRLAALADEGDASAAAALKLMDEPTNFLSTIQVGITSIGVLNGIVGEAAFSGALGAWLQTLGLTARPAQIAATGVVVTIITITTIVFGELVPKRIGQLYPETVARWVARPMRWLAGVARPFVRSLSAATRLVLALMRIDTTGSRTVTEAEITASLEEGVDAGLIEQHEHQMVQNVFRLDDRPLTSLMVPRADVRWLDADSSVAEALAVAGSPDGAHSWYPVCHGSLDDVVGVISVARLLQLGTQQTGTIEAQAQPAAFLPETLSGMEILEQLRAKSGRIVLVVDEYGVVQGLMTPLDLLEAITGELKPLVQEEAWATQRADGSWLLDGLMPVAELKARLSIEELPFEERGLYNTVAGLLMAVTGRLPGVAEHIVAAGWDFEVVDLDGRRIDKVSARPLAAELDGAAPDVSA